MFLLLFADAANALENACQRAHPLEACGLLLGQWQQNEATGTEVLVAREAPASRDGFEISDREMRRMALYAEDRKLQIVALFHSHPSGDHRLSATDRAALNYSSWPWLIVARVDESSPFTFTGYTPGDAQIIAVRVKDGRS